MAMTHCQGNVLCFFFSPLFYRILVMDLATELAVEIHRCPSSPCPLGAAKAIAIMENSIYVSTDKYGTHEVQRVQSMENTISAYSRDDKTKYCNVVCQMRLFTNFVTHKIGCNVLHVLSDLWC